MTKDVSIDISSIVKSESGTDEISMKAVGTYFEKSGLIFVFFEEQGENGLLTKSRLSISNDYLELRKQGESTTYMKFIASEITNTTYITSYANLSINIKTELYETRINKDRIDVVLKYKLLADENDFSQNEMMITIKPAM